MNKRLVKFSVPIIIIIILVGYLLSRSCKETKLAVNQPPQFSNIPTQIINEGETFPNLDLTKYVFDPDDSLISLTYTFSVNRFLKINLAKNILSAHQPDSDWFGADSIKVKVTDKDGLSGFTQIHYIVNPINDPPRLTKILDQTISEGRTFAPINLNNYISDIDNSPDEIAWTVLAQTLVDVKISKNNIAYITPITSDTFGKDTLLFIATDPGHLAATSRVYIEIKPVNDCPTIKAIELPQILEGESFPVINLNEYAFDMDNSNDQLKWKVSGVKFLSLLIDSTNSLRINVPSPDWNGKDSFVLTLSDLQCSVQTTINAIVLPVNDPPVITQIHSQTIKEDENFQSVILDEYINDVDNKPDEMTWDFSNNKLVNISLYDKRKMHITPMIDQFGSDTVKITVKDPCGLSASTHVVFSIIKKTFWERTPFLQIKNIVHQGVDDYLSLLFSPFQWDMCDLAAFGFVTGATAAATTIDTDLQKRITADRQFANNDLLTFGEYYGRDITSVGASLVFGIYGLAANDDDMTTLGLEIFESYIIVNELTRLMKYSFGRARPYMNEGSDHFYMFSGKDAEYQSLPSNHTALAFSLSSVIASHTDNYLLKSLIYSPAVLTAIERVYNNAHWTSDVLLGTAVGYFVGNFLTSLHQNKSDEKLSFGVSPNGEINVVYKFD